MRSSPYISKFSTKKKNIPGPTVKIILILTCTANATETQRLKDC